MSLTFSFFLSSNSYELRLNFQSAYKCNSLFILLRAIIYTQLHQDYLTADITKNVLIVDNLVLQGLFLLDNSNAFKK